MKEKTVDDKNMRTVYTRSNVYTWFRSPLRASDIALEAADDSLLARSSAIVENKSDFPAKFLLEYEPAVLAV